MHLILVVKCISPTLKKTFRPSLLLAECDISCGLLKLPQGGRSSKNYRPNKEEMTANSDKSFPLLVIFSFSYYICSVSLP